MNKFQYKTNKAYSLLGERKKNLLDSYKIVGHRMLRAAQKLRAFILGKTIRRQMSLSNAVDLHYLQVPSRVRPRVLIRREISKFVITDDDQLMYKNII